MALEPDLQIYDQIGVCRAALTGLAISAGDLFLIGSRPTRTRHLEVSSIYTAMFSLPFGLAGKHVFERAFAGATQHDVADSTVFHHHEGGRRYDAKGNGSVSFHPDINHVDVCVAFSQMFDDGRYAEASIASLAIK